MEKNKDENKKENLKKRKILKTIFAVLGILILIFIIFVVRRVIIINKHIDKIAEYNLNENKYKKVCSYTQTGTRITESYQKGNITKVNADFEENRKAIFYTDKSKNEFLMLVSKDDKKVAYISNNQDSIQPTADAYPSIGTNGFWDNIRVALMIKSISTENCNNQDCYLVQMWYGGKTWINKDSMLPTRDINAMNYLIEQDSDTTQVIDTLYSINTVKDEDVARPDLTGYKIIDNNK